MGNMLMSCPKIFAEIFFYNWGCMVNIIVIQEIAIDEIQGDIVYALWENIDISHEKQPDTLSIVQSQDIKGAVFPF